MSEEKINRPALCGAEEEFKAYGEVVTYRCLLEAGHAHRHYGEHSDGSSASWSTPVRTWSLPPEPGPEVTRLRDYEGNEWHRVQGGWAPVDQRYSQTGVPWSSMVFTYAPLTDATPVAASPVSDKEGRTNGR